MHFENQKIPTQLLQLITADQAHHYRILPKERKDNSITFVTDKKVTQAFSNELQIIFDLHIVLEEIDAAIFVNYLTKNYRKSGKNSLSRLENKNKYLQQLLLEADAIGASDIHFESFDKKARIRFRIDGKLIERYLLTKVQYPKLINEIKILSKLDISEKRLPQDGSIEFKSGAHDFDIRVSSLPTKYGEKIVLRILSKDNTNISLDALGLTAKELKRYHEAIKNPNGVILISGPTGSGKTTTLYATLKLLNQEDTNILTIEDPIEYTLEGINQVQLRPEIGLDFPTTLRAFLRQDPNIIMVGEIRDVETANMAIRAAQTGRLVFSTIHTNSAWGTISRLIDMGVPSFLIATTLNASIAQRLVRKLCNDCKQQVAITPGVFPESFKPSKPISTHYQAVGCESCYHTGYKGRKAIYEIIPINTILAEKIKENVLSIDDYLKQNNISSLKENAFNLVLNGITSIDEVYSMLY